ncbi:MAG: VOC family protein [Chthoniobacterales bacterium]
MDYPRLAINLPVADPAAALAFYTSAFGATERYRLTRPNETEVIHAEFTIGEALVTISKSSSPIAPSPSAPQILLLCDDVDATFDRAVKAGAVVARAVKNEYHGHRCGSLRDPAGHEWMLHQQLEALTPTEIQTRLAKPAER